MSKISELKKQNPSLSFDGVNIINKLMGKSKYTEMMITFIKNYKLNELNMSRKSLENELKDMGVNDDNFIKSLDIFELNHLTYFINSYIGYNKLKLINKFIELNEKNLIKNNDLTTYKSFDEIELQISLSELKTIDKEFERQIKKLYETDEWLVCKPLSYQSSLKYGASTKWCTASKDQPDYYFRYSKRGILIYSINKKTGNKIAGFKSLDISYENETSFWDINDQRIDSMDSGLPDDVLNIFRNEFLNTKQCNWDILTDEERNKQILWIENNKNERMELCQEGETQELGEAVGRLGDAVGRLIPFDRTTTNGPQFSEPTIAN